MKITYVIGYRHKADRIINLRKVLDWLSGFQNIDVIIVEQDKYSKLSHLNLRAKHIFIKSDKPYNRSWAFNVALKRCQNPGIIFGDSDIIMNPNEFISSINELNNFEVISPYYSVIDLNQAESNYPIEALANINRPGRGETDNQKINLCGGIVIFRKDTILRLGGWPEIFEGWGGEDDFQTTKIEKLGITHATMPYKCYHLWHQRDQVDMTLYQKTIQTLQQLNALDINQIQSHITTTSNKMGMLNKYS